MELELGYPGRGLAVNFREKCGEKAIFTAFFLHLFAVNRGELFIFTTF